MAPFFDIVLACVDEREHHHLTAVAADVRQPGRYRPGLDLADYILGQLNDPATYGTAVAVSS